MDDYLIFHIIFVVLLVYHCLLTMIGAPRKIYVPPKVFISFFLVEILAVTGSIVYICISDSLYDGAVLTVLEYLFVYFIIFITYFSLKQWIIIPDKIYYFTPEKIVTLTTDKTVVGGYIKEGFSKFYVYIDNPNYIENIKTEVAYVKYREFKKFTVFVDIVV